jgi:tryptophan 2,3-dioxygenase
MAEKFTAVHYDTYLQLGKILNAQEPRSKALGKTAHEETLFIIMHQVYELWFKQIIHELESVMRMFEDDLVDEREISLAVARINRINEIQELLIGQIRVMETMTPLDFLDFRNHLFPASGFQSFQFRVIEVLLGLTSDERLTYNKMPYHTVFDEEKKATLEAYEERRSMLTLVVEWLERTPFLETDDFNFVQAYREAVQNMLDKERAAIESSDYLLEKTKQMRLRMLGDTDTYFATVLDPKYHHKALESGQLKFSYKATVAALLIHLYREEPILQMPYQFLASIMDLEELLTTWRYRHAQMVLRMIGRKTGTGGSSGHDYLSKTAGKHRVFSDLYNISTLLIPRSDLPKLPSELKAKLGFYFTKRKGSG